MKRSIKLLGLAVLLTLFIGVGHSYASLTPIGDGGGGGDPGSPYLSSRGPATNSISWNPPQQYCNGGIGNNYPCNDTLKGVRKSPYFVVGNNAVTDPSGQTTYPHSYISLYIYLESSKKGDPSNPPSPISLTIHNASANCHDPTVKSASTNVQAPDYDNDPTKTNNATETAFSVDTNGVKNPTNLKLSAGDACDKTAYFEITPDKANNTYWVQPNPNKPGYHQGASGSDYDRYIILEALAPQASTPNQGENSFYVTTGGFSRVSFGNATVGFGYRDENICTFADTTGDCNSNNNGNTFTQAIVFGVNQYCGDDLHAPVDGKVKFSDIDARSPLLEDWNPNIHLWLQKENWNNLIISSNGTGKDPNPSWQNVEELTQADLKNMSDSSKSYQIGPSQYDPDYRYRLLLQNVGVKNTVFVTFTGNNLSQVSGVYHLTSKDCSNFSCVATVVDADNVNVKITNNSPYPDGKGFQIRERDANGNKVVVGGVNQVWPESGFGGNFGANGGSNQHNFARPPNADVNFVLYGDTGGNASVVPWYDDSGNPLPDGTGCGTTSGIIVTCAVDAQANAVPGNIEPQMYTVKVSTTGSGPGNTYGVDLSATPGAYVTGPTSASVNIPANPGSSTAYFSGYLDYQGKLTATVTYPGAADPIICKKTVTPQVSPYFQVWQNDTAAGGGFSTSDISCPGNYPAYVSPTTDPGNNAYKGGIIANSSTAKPTDQQSKSDFGAVALGLIPVSTASNEGFYASLGTTSGPSLRTWFANNLAAPHAAEGGYLNSTSSNHCVDDFYTKTKIDPAGIQSEPDVLDAILACQNDATAHGRCQYILNNNNDTTISRAANIPHGMQLTLYATGDITIDTNITYDSQFDPRTLADVPYFALITQGNVTITNNATELNGLYVVQPTPDGSNPGNITTGSGVFATCDSQCNTQLIINGSVIAQQVQLLRAHGSSQTLGCTPTCDSNAIGTAPAEIFNFVPSMVLGAPAFASTCQPACTQSAYSIAPVF